MLYEKNDNHNQNWNARSHYQTNIFVFVWSAWLCNIHKDPSLLTKHTCKHCKGCHFNVYKYCIHDTCMIFSLGDTVSKKSKIIFHCTLTHRSQIPHIFHFSNDWRHCVNDEQNNTILYTHWMISDPTYFVTLAVSNNIYKQMPRISRGERERERKQLGQLFRWPWAYSL